MIGTFLFHVHGKLRYGNIIEHGDREYVEFDHMFHNGGHYLPYITKKHLIPIFQVIDDIYPTEKEWHDFLIKYKIR